VIELLPTKHEALSSNAPVQQPNKQTKTKTLVCKGKLFTKEFQKE
jgi:hypothetical protein